MPGGPCRVSRHCSRMECLGLVWRLHSLPQYHQYRHQHHHDVERYPNHPSTGNLSVERIHLGPRGKRLHADPRKLDSQDCSKGIRSNRIYFQRSTSGDSEIRVQWIDCFPCRDPIVITDSYANTKPHSFPNGNAKAIGHSFPNAFSNSNACTQPYGYSKTFPNRDSITDSDTCT